MAEPRSAELPGGEPPEVDLAVGKMHRLPPHLKATLNPVQRLLRSSLGLLIFLLFGFFSVAIPVIGIPPVLFLLEYLGLLPHWAPRRFFDLCTGNWITIMTHLLENMFGIRIRTFGFDRRFKRRSLIIMNHVSHFDWIYLWDLVDRQGQLSFWKAITKEAPLKAVPIIGHCMQLSCFLFINRKWEQDKLEFQKKLYYFNAIGYPLQLLLFPEGGDLTPKTRQRSDAFAHEHGLPAYRYCFHPRTTGFNYVMNALRDGGLDAIYDVTIAYPDLLPKTELDAWKGFYPREVHFHVRSHSNEDVPESEEGMKEWLKERWAEKEARLKEFYAHGEFREIPADAPQHSDGGGRSNGNPPRRNGNVVNGHAASEGKRSPEVCRPHNIPYLLYSIFIFISTNAVLIIPLLYVPYFWLYMLLSLLHLLLQARRGLSEYVMKPKLKEVERAIRESKYNRHKNGSGPTPS